MRIAVLFDPSTTGAHYRARYPAEELRRRGHTILWPDGESGAMPLGRMVSADVVLVYRRCDDATLRLVRELRRHRVPFVYDNDDNLGQVPRGSVAYRDKGALRAQQRFARTVRMGQLATLMTTTNERLAAVYREAGVAEVRVVDNALAPEAVSRRHRHDGIVIGWFAAQEHDVDAVHVGLREALTEVLQRHSDARVECVGVDLGLSERYQYQSGVPFDRLPSRIAGWDVGLAPLMPHPFNEARSSIKLKEYAAVGVPWLASPVGPYRDHGEREGGRLVADGEWGVAVSELVGSRLDRWRLARRARRWASGETIGSTVALWEQALREAAQTRAGAVAG